MSSHTSFDTTEGHNVLAGNRFSGDTTINIGELKDSLPRPQVCRAIHFPRNDDFVQRSAFTEQIAKLLPPKTEYQSAAIWGLGGSGKTQLALEYAYSRCSDPACSVFWVHADNRTSFTQDYKLIATKLGIASDLDGDKLLMAVRTHIEALPQWVLVLDNADDLALFGVGRGRNSVEERAFDLSMYIPRGTVGTVLWTSRDQRIVGSLVRARCGINVVRMTQAEAEVLFHALSVLEKTENDEENDGLEQLLVELAWLPLAIAQAAAYIRRTKTSIAEYLEKIQERKRRWKVLKRSEDDPYRRPEVSNSMLETWNISMEYIKKENKLAYHILTVLAYVDNQNIPFAMIVKIAQAQIGADTLNRDISSNSNIGSSTTDSDDDDSEDDIMDLVVRLEEFSFLVLRTSDNGMRTRANRSYDMHKLVQESISYNIHVRNENSQGQANPARIAFRVVDELFPTKWQRDTWAQCEQYLGHARRTVEWAREYGGEEDVAKLPWRVVDYLYDRGRWREREIACTVLLELCKRVLGDKHPDTLSSQAQLAVTYNQQGRYQKAANMKEQVLDLRREVLGERHHATIWSMDNLSITYQRLGRYNVAERIGLEVLALRRNLLGDKAPETISSMEHLATTYIALGRYKEAERLYVEVLAMRREILGNKYPKTITAMEYLATTYRRMRRYHEAEKIYLEVLELRREVLGDKHPDTISGMAYVAMTYYLQGHYHEAEKMHSEVLELRQDLLGHKHPSTIKSMGYLASTYDKQNRYDEAEKIKVEVLALRRELLGDKHPETISSMANLSNTYHRRGMYEETNKLDAEVLAMRREILGNEHPSTISSMARLATTHYSRNRLNEAEELFTEALLQHRKVLGEEHPDTIKCASNLKSTQRALEEVADTEGNDYPG